MEKNANCFEFGSHFSCSMNEDFSFNYLGLNCHLNNLFIKLKGIYQVNNIVVSVSTVEIVNYYFNYNIEIENIKRALSQSFLEGRMEYLDRNITLILDGCHNVGSAENLVKSIEKYHPAEKFIFLISMLKDKDAKGFINKLLPVASKFIITELPNSTKSFKTAEIKKVIDNFHCKYEIIESPLKAFRKLLSYNKPSVICGSFYLIGHLKEHLLNEKTWYSKR